MNKSFLQRGRSALLHSGRSVAAAGLLLSGALLTQGCLQRDVKEDAPNTSNVFVEQIANDTITAIDLLFVIDNSVSMGDKQAILKAAVPRMVSRLINPLCLDQNGQPNGQQAQSNGTCTAGAAEFQPVNNIHVGVLTSSIGDHGATTCPPDDPAKYNDDKARLLPSVRPNLDAGPGGLGFLAWTEDSTDAAAFAQSFADQVAAVGENGCGFEAPLEAWYRFLVDPHPPTDVVIEPKPDGSAGTKAISAGEDALVLQQREAFLRPDGLVAIVVLTDENDCSAMDGGVYYDFASFGYLISSTKVAGKGFNMPIATDVCASNPNDACCFSCLQKNDPPAGCEAQAAVCQGDPTPSLDADYDNANVRCFENRRRFGIDLLYPTSRYVDALSKPEIIDARTGERVDNPLLRGAGVNAGKVRDPGLVFFAGIVGVPWQDVATDASLGNDPTMELLTAAELNVANVDLGNGTLVDRWEVILGKPGLSANSRECREDNAACGVAPVPPRDPFMVEAVEPRDTIEGIPDQNPISGDMIQGVNSSQANDINGHEADHSVEEPPGNGVVRDDLQYACIFELADPAPCPDGMVCDCSYEPTRNRPLCQQGKTGAAGDTQYYGKAYPGTRILQVLKDFGANSIVGSICPKNAIAGNPVADTDPNYGYNPAVQAIVDRLAEKLSGKCLPRELTTNPNGEVPCTVVEAKPDDDDDPLNCEADGRRPVEDKVRSGILAQLEAVGRCGGNSGSPCETFQLCQIAELVPGADGREDCLYNTAPPGSLEHAGFCYIDPAKAEEDDQGNVTYPAGGNPPNGAPGTNPLIDNCPATQRRLLRFVGKETPAPNTITFVACTGDAAGADAPIPVAPAPDMDMGM